MVWDSSHALFISLFPEFFEDITVAHLPEEGIARERIKGDVLSRTLDTIAEYIPTE